MHQVVASFDYKSDEAGHLNFTAGSNIMIITKDSSGWWYGSQGCNYGWIPSNFVEEVSSSTLDMPNDQHLSKAVDGLLAALDSNDRKLIMYNAKNVWNLIKKLPQHKNTRKVERKISRAVLYPPKSMSEWIDGLEEVSHLCLDMIENFEVFERRPSTTHTPDLDSATSLVTPVSPEILGDDLVFNSLGKVKSGSLKALMDYLVNYEQSDDVFQTIFLTTYSLNGSSKELLNHLRNTFYFQRKSDHTCTLVVKILKTWIKSFLVLKNESDAFYTSLHKFLDTGIRSFSPDDSNECIHLLKRAVLLQKKRVETLSDIEKYVEQLYSFNIIDDNATDIATILHNTYVKLFNQIEYTDWLLEKASESKSVAQMANFSKEVSKWVKGIVSEEEDFGKKAFTVHKLIKISRLLFKLQNFQGVKDIVGELRAKSLTKYSFDLEFEEKDNFNSLLSIVAQNDNNYSCYNQKLKTIEGSFIPILITHCTSLALINNQLKSFTSSGFLNFSKMAMISFAVEKILVSQRLFINEIQ